MRKEKELTNEQKNAYSYINSFVKGVKLTTRKFHLESDDRKVAWLSYYKNGYQMSNLIPFAELLGIEVNREDWNGNESCESNWDIVWFDYKGVRFFELVDKEV